MNKVLAGWASIQARDIGVTVAVWPRFGDDVRVEQDHSKSGGGLASPWNLKNEIVAAILRPDQVEHLGAKLAIVRLSRCSFSRR